MTSFAPATRAAFALLDTLVARGLEWVVLCPGSRSQALALAAAALEREGRIRLAVRIDERSAAFTALGIGVETGVPAAVITTSGSAVANLLPAVLEAHHSGVPLIVLTADRPPELRGKASNQTTTQPGMFGSTVRWQVDAPVPQAEDNEGVDGGPISGSGNDVAVETQASALADNAWHASLGASPAAIDRPGPVHVNLPYREPLSSAGRPEVWVPGTDVAVAAERNVVQLDRDKRTLVIAGSNAGSAAEECAFAGAWPLVAEVASGARFGRNLVPHSDRVLALSGLGLEVERVVIFGHPTLGREIPGLLAARDDLDVVIVRDQGAETLDPGPSGARVVDAVTVADGESDDAWLRAWLAEGRTAEASWLEKRRAESPALSAPDVDAGRSADMKDRRDFAAAELAALRTPLTRDLLVDAVWRATWPHDRLVFGASRLIRVADRAVGGKKIRVHANRGLAGIDGTVGTAAGIGLASGAVTRVVLGDLALLHDAGSLYLPPNEWRPRMQLIVGNDGGGSIFDTLEVAGRAAADDITRVLFTPQEVNLESLARAYGWEYVRALTVGELDQALTVTGEGPVLIDVPLER